MERGRWKWDDDTQGLVQVASAADLLEERARRIELDERERLRPRPSIVRGPAR